MILAESAGLARRFSELPTSIAFINIAMMIVIVIIGIWFTVFPLVDEKPPYGGFFFSFGGSLGISSVFLIFLLNDTVDITAKFVFAGLGLGLLLGSIFDVMVLAGIPNKTSRGWISRFSFSIVALCAGIAWSIYAIVFG